MKEYIPLFLLIWWAGGVLLVFGKRDTWHRFYEKIPALALWPQHYILALVLAISAVFFPLPMLVPFVAAWRAFKEWQIKRMLKQTLLKVLREVKKRKGGQAETDFDELIKRVKRL